MNKKLMLLGLCMMSAFANVQADEPEAPATDIVATETTVATTTDKEKDAVVNEDCDCGKKKTK